MAFKEDARELKGKLDEQKKIFDAQDARAKAAKDAGQDDAAAFKAAEPTEDEGRQVKKLGEEIQALHDKCSQSKEYEDLRTKNDQIRNELGQPVDRPNYGNGQQQRSTVKSIGQEFVDDPQFKAWIDRLTGGGLAEISDSASLKDSPTVNLKGLVLSSATSGGALVRRDYGPTQDLPLRPLTILDAITTLRTNSNLVEYVRVTGKTRAAAMVPEATGTSGGGYTAALKPESALALAIIQAAVQTIAVHMPATRQILADAPQIQSMIDSFLLDDLALALEEEIISGPGGANHFTGVENTAGITPQAFVTDVLTTTRKARTAALITGRTSSTGYLMNPYDWEALDLTKDLEGQYYFGGPLSMGTKKLWGLPVFESEVVPQGTAYTGNLKTIVVWDREKPSTRISESHSDFWTHNMVDILTELRAAMGVLRPASLVKIDMFSGVNS